MRIDDDPANRSAFVYLVDPPISGTEHLLDDDVLACVDAHGTLIALDVMDTPRFGTPFDEAAAERAVAWARTQLELGTAS